MDAHDVNGVKLRTKQMSLIRIVKIWFIKYKTFIQILFSKNTNFKVFLIFLYKNGELENYFLISLLLLQFSDTVNLTIHWIFADHVIKPPLDSFNLNLLVGDKRGVLQHNRPLLQCKGNSVYCYSTRPEKA